MGAQGKTNGTSIRTPLKEEKFPMELSNTAGGQSSRVLAEPAPEMMI